MATSICFDEKRFESFINMKALDLVMNPNRKIRIPNGTGSCKNNDILHSTETDFEQFLKKQSSILSTKYTFLNNKQIKQRALEMWKASKKSKDRGKANKENICKQKYVDKSSFSRSKSRDEIKRPKSVPLPVNVLKIQNNKNSRKTINNDRHVTFNNELEVRYRTTSEEGSTSTHTSKKSENQSKRVNEYYLNETSFNNPLNKNMAGRNAMKPNFDFLINDKCSWSYKAQKIVKTSNTGKEESKIESTLTTIHVSQQRSKASGSAPKNLKKNLRGKKQSQKKPKKGAETSDSFLGLYEYGDMSESNKKWEVSDISNTFTPGVPEETLSSMSPCSSESANFLLSRDVARVEECDDSAESEILPDLLPHDESSSLIVPNSKLNEDLLDGNNSDSGNFEKGVSPFGAEVKVEEPFEESKWNLSFENKLFSEKNDEDKKLSSVATLGDRAILPYEKNIVTTISSLSAGSPSSNSRIESICNDTESSRSSNAKEDEGGRFELNKDLTYDCSAQQRKKNIADKTLTFADEVRGVCEELQSCCSKEEIIDDLMNGTFSVKKYLDRERELKESLSVPRYPEVHKTKVPNDVDLVSNEQKMFNSLEYGNNAQSTSLNKNFENHLFQRQTNVSQNMNDSNSEKVIRAYEALQNDLQDTESNTNDNSLCLNMCPVNLKKNDESKKGNNEVISNERTKTRKLLQNYQDADETRHFPDASPLGLNLTKPSLEWHNVRSKKDFAFSHEKTDRLPNEIQETMSAGKIFYNEQKLNKKLLSKGQNYEPVGTKHELEIFGNRSKNEYEEMNDYSYKPINSTNSEDLFFDKRENESKKNINTSPSDVEDDGLNFTAKTESGAFNSVLKQVGFKNTVSAKKIFTEVKKSTIETRFIHSVSEMKEMDCDLNAELFIENTDSTNVIEESHSKIEDTENSNNSDAFYEVEVPHSEENFLLRKSKENSLSVPVNKQVSVETNIYDKLFIKTKKADKTKNASITSLDSEISSVKYNLRNKRNEKGSKPHQNVTQKTASSKASNKLQEKVPNKRNVRKTKQNTQPKKGQVKQKKTTNSSFVTSSPLITPIKRLIGHESEIQTTERQKRPKTWDDLEKEIKQYRHEDETAASRLGMVSRDNTCFTTISREEKSTTRNGKTVRSVNHFSGYAVGFGGSGKTSEVGLGFRLCQTRAANQTPKELQPVESQAIVERTLAAMQNCKLNYMKQVEVSGGNFEDGSSLMSNSTHERSLESEDQTSNYYPSRKVTPPVENYVPLYLRRSTKCTNANSTLWKKNTSKTLCNNDNTGRNKRNRSEKINSNFDLEDSGFQESFIGNNMKQIRNDFNSESENPWEKLQKRLQECEWKVDQLYEEKVNDLCDKRPIVHYLTKAITASEKNISNLAEEEAHFDSIEITASNSVCNRRQNKNRKVPTLALERKNVRSKIYSNRVSSGEQQNDATLSEEDASDLKLKNQSKYSAPEPEFNNSDIQENLNDDDQAMTDVNYQNTYCTTLKVPSRNIPNNECHDNENASLATTDDRNVKSSRFEDVSSCESDEKQNINGPAILSKSKNSSRCGKEAPNENSNEVRQVKLEPKQGKVAFRGKQSSERATEGLSREQQYKKTQKRSAKDDAFNDLHGSESKQISSNKTVNMHNTRRKYIPTIEVSSDSEYDNQKEDVTPQRNAKSKQTKEKYQRYVGKILQQNSQASGVTELGLFKDRCMLAQSADDLFSISSSDSDTNLKGVGLLCDILGEEE